MCCVISRNLTWPLVVGYLASELFYQLLVRWLLQRTRVQEDGTLVSPSSIVNESLRSVYTPTEERGRSHPGVGKLDAIFRWYYHAKSGIRPFYFDGVGTTGEFKWVVSSLVCQFVLLRVCAQGKSCHSNWLHYIFLNVFNVVHSGNLFDHTT